MEELYSFIIATFFLLTVPVSHGFGQDCENSCYTANSKRLDMNQTNARNSALACRLTTPELRNRKQTTISNLKGKVIEKAELANGFIYSFLYDEATFDELAMFIKTERLCCDFFDYRLVLGGDSLQLELTGPDGVKEFVADELDF